jgi:hypothetical protein
MLNSSLVGYLFPWVVVTIFVDFEQFSAEKNGVMIIFFCKNGRNLRKTGPLFPQKSKQKYFKMITLVPGRQGREENPAAVNPDSNVADQGCQTVCFRTKNLNLG